MTRRTITDEQLIAFASGEMAGEEAAHVESVLAAEPDAAEAAAVVGERIAQRELLTRVVVAWHNRAVPIHRRMIPGLSARVVYSYRLAVPVVIEAAILRPLGHERLALGWIIEAAQGLQREHVHAEARKWPDICGIRLYVEQDNARAQRVYKRLGMKRSAYRLYEIDWSREK